jgi:hypothetical protein
MQVRVRVASVGILAMMIAFSAALAQENPDPASQVDPPGRVARISFVQGNVSLEPAGVDSFSQAEMNYPLTAGDRVYVDLESISELETAGLTVRMGNGADLTLASLTDQVAQFGLAQGSIRLRTRDLTAPDGSAAVVEVDTPNGSILVQAAGDIRVDSYPQNDTTVVTVSSGQVQITGPNLDQIVGPNQSLQLSGTNPVTTQYVQILPPDGLDRFEQDREAVSQQADAVDDQYVSPDMIGASDLAQYGDWSSDADFGSVWYPRGVVVDWTPYHYGHWAWVAPWGWTWVESEPWGFAPFHYGRWGNFGGRWGWIPGPPPGIYGRPIHPIYSPALVAFVGGAPGLGVTAWFPLGPRETYVPWYHASTVYVNRVNVTGIYSRNATEVRNNYSNRTSIAYNTNVVNATFANRTVATTAVAQKDFAAGRSVAGSQPIRLDAIARSQLNQAPILPHPLVTPAATIAAPQAPARALPPTLARPQLASRATLPARTTEPTSAPARSAQPYTQPATPAPSLPQQRNHQPVSPQAQPVNPQAQPQSQPQNQPQMQPAAVAPRPAGQPRALINKTEPEPVQPSFRQQQQAIEHNDPGRPLGPQQLSNLRNGREAGAPQQPEPVQHPAPRPAEPAQPRPQPRPESKPK